MQKVTARHLGGRITAKFVLPFTNKFTDTKYFCIKKNHKCTSSENDLS